MNNPTVQPVNSSLPLFLRATALIFLAAGGLHVALGLQADLLLGAKVSPETQIDAGRAHPALGIVWCRPCAL